MLNMTPVECCQFCTEKGELVQYLFQKAMDDYNSDTVDKVIFIDSVKKIQTSWDDVKHLHLNNHEITARQLINWFFTPEGVIIMSSKDFVVYERLFLLMCLNRDVSVSALLNSILDATEYSDMESYEEIQ